MDNTVCWCRESDTNYQANVPLETEPFGLVLKGAIGPHEEK